MTARTLAAGLLALLAAAPAPAQGPAAARAAIVVDDLGNLRGEGLRALELPGPVTYAVLPHTPHGARLARLAHALDKEVIVHLPMEARSRRALGPGGLTAALGRTQFQRRVLEALAAVPHARGASNHMGSRLTALERPMGWLMRALASRGDWMFLDSRTTPATVAHSAAVAAGLRSTWRDVFLDNDPRAEAIRERVRALVRIARREGSAVAIGHPYPQTLRVLAEEIPRLPERGVVLATLGEVIERRGRGVARHARGADQSPRDQAASTSQAPAAPSTQAATGAPASIAGWKPSRP